jgi:hypothetical protein
MHSLLRHRLLRRRRIRRDLRFVVPCTFASTFTSPFTGTPIDGTTVGRSGARHGGPRDPTQPIGDVLKIGTRRGGSSIGRLHLGVDLGPMHLNASRCLDPEAHGVTANIQDDDAHVISDHNALPGAACQHQHSGLPPWTPQGCGGADEAGRQSTSGQLQAVRRC